MKRSTFIKNFAALAGGVVLSCKSEFFENYLEPKTNSSLSLEDAKSWFENSYLTNFEAVSLGIGIYSSTMPTCN